ncbi:hypothetical protein Tco_0121227 [Tanacetum coccineum]
MAGLLFRMFRVDRIEDRVTMHGVQVQLVMGELRTELGMLIQVKQGRLSATIVTENGVALDEEQLLFIAGGQDNVVDEDVDEQPVQDLALNVDNVFQADDCDAFDSDVDEAPTAQTMFMANLSSAYPVYDEAGPSYDSDILSEVHDHDHYQDVVCEHHEEHEMHDDVQPIYVVDSHANYTSDSNMIPYDHYVKGNVVPVVQSNVSSILNDAYMMIFNDMHEPHAQFVSDTTRNTVVDNSLTAKLATYKEQVELYERRARFKLTEREQKIDEQLRIVITDHNIKEEKLKKELHSVKMQLALKQGNFNSDHVKPTVLTPGKYAIDVELNSPRNRNNREVHLDYLKHLKESVETLREIVEEAKFIRDALAITPTNNDNPFVAPPSSDTVIEYFNTLGYPNTLRNVSAMFVNALYQPWRAILSMINMCLTSKTAGYDRPRHTVLQIF